MRLHEIAQPAADKGPEPKPGDWGVFIKNGGKWVLHFNYGTARGSAQDEVNYLTKSMGVEAQMFQKK